MRRCKYRRDVHAGEPEIALNTQTGSSTSGFPDSSHFSITSLTAWARVTYLIRCRIQILLLLLYAVHSVVSREEINSPGEKRTSGVMESHFFARLLLIVR